MADLVAAIGEYDASLSHSDVLSALRSRVVTVNGMATAGEVLAYIASVGKLKALRDIALSDAHPLRDAADATLTTLQTREGFDFSIPQVVGMLDAFVLAGVFGEDDKAAILSLGQREVLEFPAVTIRDVLSVRDPALNFDAASNILDVVNRRFQRVVIAVFMGGDLPAPANLVLQVKNSDGQWRGSSAQGITNVQSAGTYHVVVPGDLIMTDAVQIKVVCPFAMTPLISVEG